MTPMRSIALRCAWLPVALLVLLLLVVCTPGLVVLSRIVSERHTVQELDRLGVSVFRDSGNVVEVCIEDGVVTDEIADALIKLRNLRVLVVELPEKRADHKGLANVAKLKQLTELCVSGWPATDSEVRQLSGPATITEIRFYYSEISDVGLEHLRVFPNLKAVRVYGSRVTAGGVKKLQAALPGVEVGWDGDGVFRENTAPPSLWRRLFPW